MKLVEHSGDTGEVVTDQEWSLGPDDEPRTLPRVPSVGILRALRKGVIRYVDSSHQIMHDLDRMNDDVAPIEDPTAQDEAPESTRDILRILVEDLITSGHEEDLTGSGKPKVDVLKALAYDADIDPDVVTAELRNDLYYEVVDVNAD